MVLKHRLLLSFYSAASTAALAAVAAFYLFVTPAYFDIEEDAVRNEVVRVETAFMQSVNTLYLRSRDWAERAQVQALVAGDRQALPSPPGVYALGDRGVDQVVVFDEQGQQHWLLSGNGTDQHALSTLYSDYQARSCYPFWGVTKLSGVPHLFALEQVGECGAVFFSLALDDGLAQKLSGITGLLVQLAEVDGQPDRATRISPLGEGMVQGEFTIRDYHDQAVMLGSVTLDRSTYVRSIKILTIVAIGLLVVAWLTATLVHVYVRRTVFTRLEHLRDTVQRIAQGGNLDLRVRVPGNDELSALAADFNRMVDSIKDSQHSLAEASEQAEAASRAKSLFLANMSHEIRTPMTAILGYIELLEHSNVSEQERQRYVSIIQKNGDALIALISDVLDLSRIEAGQSKIERQSCALPPLMKEVIYSHSLKAKGKGIRLELEYQSPVPSHVITDAFRLRQILNNLIGNAIKFTDDGQVTVQLRWEDGLQSCLHIVVEDSGIGMSEKDLERLFEPFSQVDDSHTRRHGGTGLGLAIARQLARSMGGDISVSSNVGHGSVFKVHLQMLAAADAKRVLPQQALETGLQSQPLTAIQVGGRVLLVEDNDVNRLLVQSILSRAGMQVVEAVDNLQALDVIRADRNFDLIILDMQMPVMDGYTAAGELRRLGFNKPILALTANVMADDRQRCLAAGCDDFLGKPVRARRLIATCARLINQGRTIEHAAAPDVAGRE